MMTYPLMPIFKRQGRIINGLGRKPRKRRMRGGNLLTDVGRSAMNIFTSNNKKQAALSELKNLNSTLRQNKYISNYLKGKTGVLGKIGTVAGLAGYGRRRRKRKTLRGGNTIVNGLKKLNQTLREQKYISRFLKNRNGVLGKIGTIAGLAGYGRKRRRKTLRGGSFFGKVFGGIKKAINVVTKPADWVASKIAAPIVSYGVSKLIGGRRPRRYGLRRNPYSRTLRTGRKTYRPVLKRKTYRRKQRGGFLLSLIGAPILKKVVGAAAKPVVNKLKNTAINYAKSEGAKLLNQLSDKIGAGRRRYRRKKRL